MKNWFLLFAGLFMLIGCTVITYEETRNPEFHFHAEGQDSKIDTRIEGVDVATKRTTGQEGESKSAIDADTALSQAGSTLAKTLGDVIMEGVSSKLDQTKTDSDNPVTNTTANPPAVVKPEVKPDVKPDDPGGPVVHSAPVVTPPTGKKTIAYRYAGLTNGDRPTWRLRTTLKIGSKFTFKCGPVGDYGVARSRKGGVGWDNVPKNEVVKNSSDYPNEMAILIDKRHKGNFKPGDCSITLYDTSATDQSKLIETGEYRARSDNRPYWNFLKSMKEYPETLRLVIDGCYDGKIVNNGARWQTSDKQYVVKQSTKGGWNTAVIGAASCQSKVAAFYRNM